MKLDSDAKAYISILGIKDELVIKSINDFTLSLKSSNLWSKMKSVYPNPNFDLKSAKKTERKNKINRIFNR